MSKALKFVDDAGYYYLVFGEPCVFVIAYDPKARNLTEEQESIEDINEIVLSLQDQQPIPQDPGVRRQIEEQMRENPDTAYTTLVVSYGDARHLWFDSGFTIILKSPRADDDSVIAEAKAMIGSSKQQIETKINLTW